MADIVPIRSGDNNIVGDGLALDPDVMLEANKGRFAMIVLIGTNKDGEIEICSSHSSRESLWMLRKAERIVIEVD